MNFLSPTKILILLLVTGFLATQTLSQTEKTPKTPSSKTKSKTSSPKTKSKASYKKSKSKASHKKSKSKASSPKTKSGTFQNKTKVSLKTAKLKSSPTENKETVEKAETQKPETEPMKEGDRLTFMQKTESIQRSQPETGGFFFKTLGAMFLIVGMVFFGAWGLKKLGFGINNSNASQDSPKLTILSSVSPKSGQTISVVRFGERTLLVGSTAQSFTLLAEEESWASNFENENNGTQPVSVAEMLARENVSFDEELTRAENRLNFSAGRGVS